ncbi:TPA: AAA family ATPase [Streptococcus suis]
MKKKGMRLVAMIESKDEKYEVINFLPDIKVKYTDEKEFKIEKNEGYIKIPYAEGIDDLTVIVGENGVGKTTLLNSISSLSEDRYFIFKNNDKIDPIHKGRFCYNNWHILNNEFTDNNEHQLILDGHKTTMDDFEEENITDELSYLDWMSQKTKIIKYSHSIETNRENVYGDYLDLSTSDKLNKNKLSEVYYEDFHNQLKLVLSNSYGIKNIEELLQLSNKIFDISVNVEGLASLTDLYPYYLAKGIKGDLQAQLTALLKYYIIDCLFTEKIKNNSQTIREDINEIISDEELVNKLFECVSSDINLGYKEGKNVIPNSLTSEFNDLNKTLQEFEADFNAYKNGKEFGLNLHKDSDEFVMSVKGSEKEAFKTYIVENKTVELKELMTKILAFDKYLVSWEEYSNKKISDLLNEITDKQLRLWNKEIVAVIEELLSDDGEVRFTNDFIGEKTIKYHKKEIEYHAKDGYSIIDLDLELVELFFKIVHNELDLILDNTSISYSDDIGLSLKDILGIIRFSWKGMSSGEYALFNLFGRLYSIVEKVRGDEGVLLLLDEVDLGLHPEWQRRWISVALPIIKEIFKGKHIQIIMTTHSPIMLSDIYADNVIMLRKDTNGNRIIVENQGMEKNQVTTFGQNIHDLYRDSFFLESTRGEYAKEQIQETTKVLYELELWQDEDSRIRDIYKGKCKERYKELFASDTDDLDKKIDEEAFEVWFSHRSQIEKDIENIKKISNEEEYANLFYEKYYKTKDQGKFTDLFKERFNDDKQIIEKLKSGEIIFPEFNETNYKDEYKTQYREKYIKLRDDILNNSFIREKIQKSSSDDRFKQILKYRIDAIGEQLIKRKLLSMWDKIWFSENLSDSPSEKSEMNGLFQQLKEASGNNKQILTIVSEIEKLINSHNGEE